MTIFPPIKKKNNNIVMAFHFTYFSKHVNVFQGGDFQLKVFKLHKIWMFLECLVFV